MSTLKKVQISAIIAGFLLIGPMVSKAAGSSTPAVPGNLILNAQMLDATVSSSTPDHWVHGGFNATTTYTYPVTGPLSDDKAVEITVTGISGGAAEWVFETVPVTGGQTYAFSDWYKSNVDSYLIVQWTLPGSVFKYEPIATLPNTNGSWVKTPQEVFTPPSNATTMTIFHQLGSVGILTTSNYSLLPYSTSSQDALSEGVVSLTFDDGWASQYDNAWPILKTANFPGTFYIITNPMKLASYDFFKDLVNESGIETTTTAFGTTWSTIYPDPTNSSYRFSDSYQGTGTSTIVVTYTPANSSTSSMSFSLNSASGGSRSNQTFILPPLATSSTLTISHTSALPLTATSPALNENGSGYLGSSQIVDLQNAGNEIGNHTTDHCNLYALDQNPNSATTAAGQCVPTLVSPTTALTEIGNAKNDLNAIGISNVSTLAYPYGDYDSNIESQLNGNSLLAARSVDIGYNTKSSDIYALKSESLDTTSSLSDVYSWINYAKTNKVWLILVIHQVDDPATLTSNGEEGGITPATFQSIVDYLKTNNVSVKTVKDTLAMLGSVTPPPPPPTPTPTPTSTINMVLSVDNTGNGTSTPSDFTITSSGASSTPSSFAGNASGTPVTVNTNEAFSITASTMPNYTASSSTACAGTLAAGTTATCTITETFVAPTPVPTPTPTPEPTPTPAPVTTSSGGGGGSGYIYQPLYLFTDQTTATTTGKVLGATIFKFLRNLAKGSRGDDVTQLQTRLSTEGVYTGPITGYFGVLTEAGAKAFQSKYNIPSTGFVGILTRGALNK